MEAIAGDASKGDEGIDSLEALNLQLTSAPAAPPADVAGSSAGAPAAGAAVKLAPKDREAALAAFAEQGWLAEDDEAGRFRLGPRTFLELGSYLLDTAAKELRETWAARV